MKYFFLAFITCCWWSSSWPGRADATRRAARWNSSRTWCARARSSRSRPSGFFADGVAARRPVEGVVPMGYEFPQKTAASQIAAVERAGTPRTEQPRLRFTDAPDYYDTGKMGDQWGTGIPIEVTPELHGARARAVQINCQVCHGGTGGGNGVTSKYGLAGIANYHDDKYLKMADGEIFNTITNGHNTMLGYGANITVHDRWAIVCLHPRAATLADWSSSTNCRPDAGRDAVDSPSNANRFPCSPFSR